MSLESGGKTADSRFRCPSEARSCRFERKWGVLVLKNCPKHFTGEAQRNILLRFNGPRWKFWVNAFERQIATLDLPGLIRAKRAAGREKDLAAVAELESLGKRPPMSEMIPADRRKAIGCILAPGLVPKCTSRLTKTVLTAGNSRAPLGHPGLGEQVNCHGRTVSAFV